AALKALPGDVLVLRSAATFDMRAGRFQDAVPHLRTILGGKVQATEADLEWARHDLAVSLAAQADYAKLLQALDLVGLKLTSAGEVAEKEEVAEEPTAEERLARAHVLALQPLRKLRARAVALLEGLHHRHLLSPEDQHLLAQLYQAEGHATKARAQ